MFDGEIELAEDDVLEQDRGEEGEGDDSPALVRKVRVLALYPGDLSTAGVNARNRRQWEVLPLRTTVSHRRVGYPG